MINLVFKIKNNSIIGFSCNGHSGYAEAGQDIVCAAVSSLVQNAEICISEVLNIKLNVKRDDKNAKFEIKFSKNVSNEQIEKAQPILKALKLSSQRIEKEYKKYLKVEVENEIV